jgi:hypothetical protein
MISRTCGLSLIALLALLQPACNNTLNPLCSSARPVPVIGSLAPSTVTFAEVQMGTLLVVNGNQFVSSSELIINGKTLGATVVSAQQMKIMLTTGVITAPGPVNVSVTTPSGSSGDVGCSSGGTSSALALTVN